MPDQASIQVAARAKVNLRLVVFARERSGYHQIESLFCALELSDQVTIELAGQGVQLEVEGASLGPPSENLVVRAAAALLDAIGSTVPVRLRLHKRIPAGAGLGGGPSDAAATLRGLNGLLGYPLDGRALLALAAGLGSDVPFFLAGSPLALGWGRGERLLALRALPPRPVLLAVPPFQSDTAAAYQALDQVGAPAVPGQGPLVIPAGAFDGWDAVARIAHNDFEPILFRRHPQLGELKAAFFATGCRVALLAGSGSAVFAVYEDEAERARAVAALPQRFPDVRFIETQSDPRTTASDGGR